MSFFSDRARPDGLSLRHHRLGWDMWGFVFFLWIMAPNLIWFAFPAPNDILRAGGAAPVLETAASLLQAALVAAICLVKNIRSSRPMGRRWRLAAILAGLLYDGGWAAYYWGLAGPAVIFLLCAAPCAALFCFAAGRKNLPALTLSAAFGLCHTAWGVLSFIL